jgi:hypothetical protein
MRTKSRRSATARLRRCPRVDHDRPADQRVCDLLRDPRLRRASELPPLERCPDCRGRVFEVALGAAAVYARRQCGACGRRLGHVPADPSRALEWAVNLEIRSGRHAGRTLGEPARRRASPCWCG